MRLIAVPQIQDSNWKPEESCLFKTVKLDHKHPDDVLLKECVFEE